MAVLKPRTKTPDLESKGHMNIVELLRHHEATMDDRVTEWESVVPDPILDVPSILPPVP